MNGNCIAINGGVGGSAGEAATVTASASSSAGVTKITITSENSNNSNNSSGTGNGGTTSHIQSGYKNSSLVSITSLNSCSDLSQGSTATLPLSGSSGSSSTSTSVAQINTHPLSHQPVSSARSQQQNSGSDTSSNNNFQERFDFEHWKGLLSDYNCFHGLYRYWNQYSGRGSTNTAEGNLQGSSSRSQQQSQSQSDHENNGLGSGGNNSFYTHNILGYTFGYPFGLKEDLDASGNCQSNTSTLGFRKSISEGNQSHNSSETPLQKHYRQQQKKKMPVFRGRRAWCGCFKVSPSLGIRNFRHRKVSGY